MKRNEEVGPVIILLMICGKGVGFNKLISSHLFKYVFLHLYIVLVVIAMVVQAEIVTYFVSHVLNKNRKKNEF